ncbi:MAG: PulJ/GspJ family protein [Cyanobacterium sp.]
MKNKKILLKLLQQSSNKGITLTELLVALVISGIVLTATASGFVNVLRANRGVESKSNQLSNLTRALTFIQEDIKQGISVRRVQNNTGNCTSGSTGVDSDCLAIRLPGTNTNEIYYGFKDISGDSSVFLKPGILKRQEYNSSGAILVPNQSTAWEEEFTTVADGLEVNKPNFHSAPNPECQDGGLDSINWSSNANNVPHGVQNTGFRFCLESDEDDNRLARIFLYGHIIDSDTPANVDVVTFARSQP